MSNTPLLTARKLSKTFAGRDGSSTVALDAVNLDLYPGEVVALIGESGSGKTTLGRALLRLLKLDAGTLTFDGVDLLKVNGAALRQLRRHMQMIFQNQQANLHPKMSVSAMLDESLRLHQSNLTPEQRGDYTTDLLSRVGLADHSHRYVASLSGGEQRRVGLARILATTPKLIVADEPTSGLDAAIKLQMITLLKELKSDELIYLLISHDLSLVRKIADRVLVMLRGRIIEEIPMSELGHIKHHPYTEKLLAAAELGDRDLSLDGVSIEDVDEGADGCSYASICPLAQTHGILARCSAERPALAVRYETQEIEQLETEKRENEVINGEEIPSIFPPPYRVACFGIPPSKEPL